MGRAQEALRDKDIQDTETEMTNRSKLTILMGMTVALAGAVSLSLAVRGMGPGRPKGGPHAGFGAGAILHRLVDDPALQQSLHLSNEQVARLEQISTAARKGAVTLRAEVHVQRIALRSLIDDPASARSAIEAQIEKVAQAMHSVRSEMTRDLLDARDVLTVDQRGQLKDAIRARIGKMSRHGPRMRGGPPCAAQDDGVGADPGEEPPRPDDPLAPGQEGGE